MSIASLLSIKVTSPITHMVSSAVRGVAASLLGMWLFHDVITTYAFLLLFSRPSIANVDFTSFSGRASSIAIILGGSVLYTWYKHRESQATASTSPSRRGSYERVKMEDVEQGVQKESKPE